MSKQSGDKVLKRDGQAQSQRMPAWLDPTLLRLDDRDDKALFTYLFNIAKEIKFFDHNNPSADLNTADATWQELFKYDAANADLVWQKLQSLKDKQALPPQFGLLLAFIELYRQPQRLANTISSRHLDFYYHDVLGLEKNDPVPDRAHVVFELKKNTSPLLLEAVKTKLPAGKDVFKKDLIYAATHDIIVNNSKVQQLRSLFIDPSNKDQIRFAGIANSADGMGAAPDKQNPKWNAFGYEALPLAQVGFCLASDVLLMQEGDRTINVDLDLEALPESIKDGAAINDLFVITASTQKGWTEEKSVSPTVARTNARAASLSFAVNYTEAEDAITAANAAVHGDGFATGKPVLRVMLNSNASAGYQQFKNANLTAATINVSVKGAKNLQLENDFGVLNAKKPFYPFGSAAETDANFWVGYEEAFAKQLTQLQLNIEWKNIPATDLGSYYNGTYSKVTNNSFSVNASFRDAAGWIVKNSTQQLFDAANAKYKDENNVSKKIAFNKYLGNFHLLKTFQLPVLPARIKRSPGLTLMQEITGKASQFQVFKTQKKTIDLLLPLLFFFDTHNANIKDGFLHLVLNYGFKFKEYRELFTKQVLEFAKGNGTVIDPLNEPFAPQAQTISLDYTATTGKVSFTDASLGDFIGAAIELYHASPFGQMREHAYARQQWNFLTDKQVKLLPQFHNEGNFFIGLSGIGANESLCLLLQVAPGSADPALPKVSLQWKVLCDNYWKKLDNEDFIFDTTNGLLASGVVKLVIPREATTENTIMPNHLLWLQVSIRQYSKAVCQLADVRSNAAIVQFEDHENDPLHLAKPLDANTISKLQTPVAGIKTVLQPYASFGGQMQENNNGFYTRVSERLRHKQRAIACWDYERIILQQFPSVYKVKCLNHASPGNFSDAGHQLIVVIPGLGNQNAVNPFQPAVDKNTLDEILKLISEQSSAWAEHHVINPFYEPVKIAVSVKLKTGFEFNYYQKEINKVLQTFLSPWINGEGSEIHFGGKVTESQVVKLVEDLPYVDYITALQLFHSVNGSTFTLRKHKIEATNPAAILVSHTQHDITQY